MTRKVLVVIASLATLGVVAVAGEAAVTTNVTIPSEFVFFDPCTNESVFVSGDVHLVSSATVTDNTLTSHTHSDFKATGVGPDRAPHDARRERGPQVVQVRHPSAHLQVGLRAQLPSGATSSVRNDDLIGPWRRDRIANR